MAIIFLKKLKIILDFIECLWYYILAAKNDRILR